MNALRYLGGGRTTLALPAVAPGQAVPLLSSSPAQRLFVTTPAPQRVVVPREAGGNFVFAATELPGVYEVREAANGPVTQRFAVNLFHRRESDLRPAPEIKLEHESIPAQSGSEPARRETWKWLLLLATLVLVAEWYIYNRRVYI
jgi:hypothetical protein